MATAGSGLDVPEFWSLDAVELLAQHCAAPTLISTRLKPVPEDDVPIFLWRHEPDQDALAGLPIEQRTCGETDLRAVIDRIAGAWAYRGWKAGYFDADSDAGAFYDEIRWILLHRLAAPELSQWRHTGLYWAYGIDASAPDCFLVDHRTGTVRRGEANAMPPSGAVINGVTPDATGDGGIWALWRNQARLAELGCPSGVDVSALATGCDDDLAALLAPGDKALFGKRRVTLQSDHHQADRFATRNLHAAMTQATETVGQAITQRHASALAESCATEKAERARRFALGAAAQAALPADMIECIATLAGTGQADRLLATLSDDRAPRPETNASITVLAMNDAALDTATDPASPAGRLLDSTALSGWMAGAAGLHYTSTVDRGHGCAKAGPVRSAAGDGDFLFLDDTATGRAVLNSVGFLDAEGVFDTDGFRHVAGLITIALDISLCDATHATPRIARRVWDYRPVSLSLTGLAPLLMSLGIAYDSSVGRATAATLCSLMTGAAYVVSAEIAGEIGAFPGWTASSAAMRAMVDAHACATTGTHCAIAGAADAARDAWGDARTGGKQGGYRNAQVSAIYPAHDESILMDAGGAGIAPSRTMAHFERLEGGGYQRRVNPAIPSGLRALGYDTKAIDAILCRLLGHGSIEHAPGVNHQTLRRRGFTDAAIATVEAALGDASDVRQAFDTWTLGEMFCTRMLGFTDTQFDDPEFDTLTALGYSNAGIEAANVHCHGAGTLEGAPRLDRAHLAVFDGAGRQGALGRRQITPEAVVRMMAAMQPFLSGGIGHVVELPHAATVADFRALLLLGWRLGLKTLTLGRAASGAVAIELARPAAAAPIRVIADSPPPPLPAEPAHTTRAMSQALALAYTARSLAGDSASEKVIATNPERVTGDARASCRESPDSPRSAASVSSSADVVVEQRQV
ncbi:MAG: hypothetical protein V3R85_03530 [Alphaproteobacteria bacterium]